VLPQSFTLKMEERQKEEKIQKKEGKNQWERKE